MINKTERNHKNKNNPNYKDGRTLKKYYCKDCGKKIWYRSIRCKSCARKGKFHPMFGKKGKNAPNYIHGKGYEPYISEFTDKLKKQIRHRDNYTCQKCGMTEEEHLTIYKKILEIHHIDYDKENCNEENLITLCKQCNVKANFNRDYWYAYFRYIMEKG